MRYYKNFKHDKQRQIDNLLSVYDFIGKSNRKKPIPTNTEQTSPKKGEHHEKIQR